MTELAIRLDQIGRGRPPPETGEVSVLPGPTGAAVAAVWGFTGHHIIAADADPAWLRSLLTGAEMGRPLKPTFLAALAEQLNASAGGQDALLVHVGADVQSELRQPAVRVLDPARLDHPRVDRALRYREEVTVWTVPAGVMTIGRGLAGRWEVSIEVEPAARGRGIGRMLARHGRGLIPAEALVWAQVHPANVASLRAFLAAGYRPVGAEVLFTRAAGVPHR